MYEESGSNFLKRETLILSQMVTKAMDKYMLYCSNCTRIELAMVIDFLDKTV